MDLGENNSLLDAIANKAFFQCFKKVFYRRGGIKATEREDIQMELCLFNYIQTYQQVLKTSIDYIKEQKQN